MRGRGGSGREELPRRAERRSAGDRATHHAHQRKDDHVELPDDGLVLGLCVLDPGHLLDGDARHVVLALDVGRALVDAGDRLDPAERRLRLLVVVLERNGHRLILGRRGRGQGLRRGGGRGDGGVRREEERGPSSRGGARLKTNRTELGRQLITRRPCPRSPAGWQRVAGPATRRTGRQAGRFLCRRAASGKGVRRCVGGGGGLGQGWAGAR